MTLIPATQHAVIIAVTSFEYLKYYCNSMLLLHNLFLFLLMKWLNCHFIFPIGCRLRCRKQVILKPVLLTNNLHIILLLSKNLIVIIVIIHSESCLRIHELIMWIYILLILTILQLLPILLLNWVPLAPPRLHRPTPWLILQ